MKIISYDGQTFSTLGVTAGIADESQLPGPDIRPVVEPRRGGPPLYAGRDQGARPIPVTFLVQRNQATEQTLLTLLGKLDMEDEDERPLQATIDTDGDGTLETTVEVQASVGPYQFLKRNMLLVVFHATDPVWRETTDTTSGPHTFSSSGTSVTVTNNGHARAHPIYEVTPTVQRLTESATVGWKWRRTVTLTNNELRAEQRETKFIDLGDTTALTTAKALASGDDVRVFRAGRELPRTLINWDTGRTFLVVVVSIPAKSSVTLDIVYGNPDAGAPKTLGDQGGARTDPTRFSALDLLHVNGTTTGGTNTTIVEDTNHPIYATFTVNRFRGGFAQITSGVAAGERRRIASNDANGFTVTRAFSVDPGAAASYVVWCAGLFVDGGQATVAGTTTTLTDGSQSFETNSLTGGTLTNVTKGESRTIKSNTATVITIEGTMTAPALNDVYHVERQGFHAYRVEQMKRDSTSTATLPSGDIWLGLWYQDARFTRPGVIGFGAAGYANAWNRYLLLRNRDGFNNDATFPIDVGAGDIDYFNGLDADRRAGSTEATRQEQTSDGVTISNPHGFIGITWDYQIKNPSGIATATLRARTDGGAEWATVHDDSQTQAALTAVAVRHDDLSAVSEVAVPLHLFLGLLPADPDNIPPTANPRDTATFRQYQRMELYLDVRNWSVGTLSAEEAVYDLNGRIKLAALAAVPPYDQIEFGGDGRRVFVPINNAVWVRTDPDLTEPVIAEYSGSTLIRPLPWAALIVRYLTTQTGAAVATIPVDPAPLPAGNTTVTYIESEIGTVQVTAVFAEGYLG